MKILKLIPAFAIAVAAMVSCKSNANQEVQATPVEAITLKDTSCVVKFSFPATIKGIQDVNIYPQVRGRITAIKVIEGQYVRTGDVLFTIDDVPYKAAYDAAAAQVEVSKAQLETARLTLNSKQNLFDKNIISEYQLKLAKNDVVTAEAILGQSNASLKDAANNLSFTKVRTMSNGYIGTLPYKVGSLVGPEIKSPLTVVSDNSSIYADFSIPERMQLTLGIGTSKSKDKMKSVPLYLITNLGAEYENEGFIHSTSGLISNETGSLPIRSIFPNPEGKLLSGGSCSVVIKYHQDNVILIPRASIKEIQNKMFVYLIKDGKLSQTEVYAERYDKEFWTLMPDEKGVFAIKVGDQITKTTNRLFDGQDVVITNSGK